MFYTNTMSRAADVNTAMSKVFGNMFLGLMVTALVSALTASAPAFMAAVTHGGLGMLVLFAPLAFVLAMSLGYEKFSGPTLKALFFVYAAINGLSLSVLTIKYSGAMLFTAFITTATVFGAMAAYGYFTKKDLTSWGPILFFGLIGLLVAMIVNIFVGGTVMAMIVSMAAVVIFLALTAYDAQKIRDILIANPNDSKASTMGSLTLYLDFLNLFLHILRLLGLFSGGRDD